MTQRFILRIAGSYTPDDIPLARLGEYLTAFAEFLGETANVHFEEIRSGSTMLVARPDHVAERKVEDRVRRVSTGEGTEAERKAYHRIDDMLRDDNATGQVIGQGTNNVIHVDFPGRERVRPVAYGPIKQAGVIDGEIFRIEGRDDTVHVGVMDGRRTFSLYAPAGRAQDLAVHFRAGPIRFNGEGTWYRRGDGSWELRKFRIDSFSALDNSPLSAVIEGLRKVGVGGWKDVEDPSAALAAERGEKDRLN